MRSTRYLLSSAFALTFVLTALGSATAAQRVVLFEEAKNFGCPPCATTDPIIHGVLDSFGDQVASVKWYTWWPSANDPFYNYNPDPVDTRVPYYGITGVPDVLVDGLVGPDPFSASNMTNAINQRLAVPSPVAISVDGIVASDTEAEINVSIDVETPQAGSNYRLFVALAENYKFLMGPNGSPHHYDIFRWSNNNASGTGETIDLSTAGVQNFSYTMPVGPDHVDTELAARVWVQDYTTREVLNAGAADLLVLYDMAMDTVGATGQIGTATEVTSYSAILQNLGAADDTYDLTVSGVPAGWSYSYTTPAGTFSGPSTLTIPSLTNAAISLELDSQGASGTATVTLTAASQGNPGRQSQVQFQKINNAQVVLVDDDMGGARNEAVGQALDAAGVIWGHWDMTWGPVTTADLNIAGQAVFWLCDATGTPSLDVGDRDAISGLLDGGGKLAISGQDIGYEMADPSSPYFSGETIGFYVNYLHANYFNTGPNTYFVDGTPGDAIGDGLTFGLQPSGANAQTEHDAITAGFGADLVFAYDNSFGAAVKWTDGTSHVYYSAFGMEGFYEDPTRDEVIGRILAWMGISGTTGLAGPAGVAPGLRLAQNTPNPFRPATTITYTLNANALVALNIFDVGGRLVRELVDRRQTANTYTVDWDGRDAHGQEVASGVYFYRLELPGHTETRRMVLSR